MLTPKCNLLLVINLTVSRKPFQWFLRYSILLTDKKDLHHWKMPKFKAKMLRNVSPSTGIYSELCSASRTPNLTLHFVNVQESGSTLNRIAPHHFQNRAQ